MGSCYSSCRKKKKKLAEPPLVTFEDIEEEDFLQRPQSYYWQSSEMDKIKRELGVLEKKILT
jgi:hypothetical protein